MNLRLPSLMMLNLDWTCVTEASSLEYLNTAGTVAKQYLTYLPHSRVASLVPRLNLLYPLPALGFVFLETRVKYMYKGFVSMETFPETCAVDHRPGD